MFDISIGRALAFWAAFIVAAIAAVATLAFNLYWWF